MSEFTTVDLVDTDGDLYVDTDGDGVQETVVTGPDAAVFPVDPLA
jgi:hypothetical protein